jgi:hypothetical protein
VKPGFSKNTLPGLDRRTSRPAASIIVWSFFANPDIFAECPTGPSPERRPQALGHLAAPGAD